MSIQNRLTRLEQALPPKVDYRPFKGLTKEQLQHLSRGEPIPVEIYTQKAYEILTAAGVKDAPEPLKDLREVKQ